MHGSLQWEWYYQWFSLVYTPFDLKGDEMQRPVCSMIEGYCQVFIDYSPLTVSLLSPSKDTVVFVELHGVDIVRISCLLSTLIGGASTSYSLYLPCRCCVHACVQ